MNIQKYAVFLIVISCSQISDLTFSPIMMSCSHFWGLLCQFGLLQLNFSWQLGWFLQILRSHHFTPPPKTSKSCFLKSDATVSCISTANLGDDKWGDGWGRRGNQKNGVEWCWSQIGWKMPLSYCWRFRNQAIATWDVKKTLYVVT